jgi:ribosomal protein L32
MSEYTEKVDDLLDDMITKAQAYARIREGCGGFTSEQDVERARIAVKDYIDKLQSEIMAMRAWSNFDNCEKCGTIILQGFMCHNCQHVNGEA